MPRPPEPFVYRRSDASLHWALGQVTPPTWRERCRERAGKRATRTSGCSRWLARGLWNCSSFPTSPGATRRPGRSSSTSDSTTSPNVSKLWRAENRRRQRTTKYRAPLCRASHLSRSGTRTGPTAQQIARQQLRADYEDYLVRQRGISQRTIFHAWRFADRFLDHRFGIGDVDLAAITPGDEPL